MLSGTYRYQLYVVRLCKIQRKILSIDNTDSSVFCASLDVYLRIFVLYFDVVAKASATVDSKYPTATFSTWIYEFSRGETTSSCSHLAGKIERSARWSSRKGDEARDWQRKYVNRVPRFRSHSDDAPIQDVKSGIYASRSSKIFHFRSPISIVEKFGRRRYFESRAIGMHSWYTRSFYLVCNIFWKIWHENRVFLPMLYLTLPNILAYVLPIFQINWPNFTKF